MPSITSLANWLLRLPLLWGGLATLAFYALLKSTGFGGGLLNRYFASHPVEVVATLLFFVGAAALVLRLGGLIGQLGASRLEPIGPVMPGGQPCGDASALLERLEDLHEPLRKTLLVRRLRSAIEYVRETGTADSLEDELVRLEDADRDRVATGYALPRLIRATLPIIGMLGTVIGITLAIGQLSPDQLEESLTEVMAALSVAFDTTAQAMSLMLVLWFAMFGVERVEERLLDEVDIAAKRQLLGRFQVYGSQSDPNVAAIRRMGEEVITAVDQLSARQADTWQTAIDETHEKWSAATSAAGEVLTTSLANGLRDGLRDHATGLTSGIEAQLAKLAEGLNEQQAHVAEAVRQQVGSLQELQQEYGERFQQAAAEQTRTLQDQQQHVASAVREQLASLQTLQEDYANRLEALTEGQTNRIVTGADGLLGNLREGLERMAELLVEALEKHGETLTAAEAELASENRRHLGEVEAAIGEAMVVHADRQEKLVRQSESVLREMQQALVSAAGATIDHQQELVKQGEVLLKVVESTGQVQRLEESLNRNLASLGRGHNFEETLMSLSAAIQLLSARVDRGTDADSSLPKAA